MIDEQCQDCKAAETKKYYGVYTLTCKKCRERMLMSEPCKILRKYNADYLEKHYGDLPEWKKDPSCDCISTCKRKSRIRIEPKPDNN